MDPPLLMVAAAGALAGVVAMAVPGAHVNALALAVLALAPAAGETGAIFLVAALAGSPFGLALSSTFLGASGDESAIASLPAHALAREGRALEAVALQCWGAFAGIAVALPAAFALRPALRALAPRLSDAMPWLLLATVLLLALSERARPPVHPRLVVVAWGARRLRGRLLRDGDDWRIGGRRVVDPHRLLDAREAGLVVDARVERSWTEGPLSRAAGCALALFVLALSGALGLVALRMGARSPLGLPASILLPLLAGLFAAPALAASAVGRAEPVRARLRAPRPPKGEVMRRAAPGALVSSLLGIVPGVSASHVALLAPRSDRAEAALVTLGAVNGGGVVFTLLAWHALDRARAGALVAAQALSPPTAWTTWAPPPGVMRELEAVLLAACVACLAARALSSLASRALRRVMPRTPARAGLALLVVSVTLTTGGWGLLVFGVAAFVGATPAALGVRRSHAMGAILVPALLRAWGLA